jgi:hypothetical protein
MVPVDELLSKRGLTDPPASADNEAFPWPCRTDLVPDLTENLVKGGEFPVPPDEI